MGNEMPGIGKLVGYKDGVPIYMPEDLLWMVTPEWYAEQGVTPLKPSILGVLLPAVTFGLGLYLFAKSK